MDTNNRDKKTKHYSPRQIPTREEFHREFAGVISSNDFITSAPTGGGTRQRTHTESPRGNFYIYMSKFN